MARLPRTARCLRAAETVADIGVMLIDDGFDAIHDARVRGLAELGEPLEATEEVVARRGNDRPAAAWRSIRDHWTIDIAAIAAGAAS